MTRLFIDIESVRTATVSLTRQTLRRYLRDAPLLGLSYAIDDEDPVWVAADSSAWPTLIVWLREMADADDVIFIAHNASFDIRALRFGWVPKAGGIEYLLIPQPKRVHCSMELAYAAWPNQPGAPDVSGGTDKRDPHAYSLKSLATTLSLGLPKLDMKTEDLGEYCMRDVELCRLVYDRAIRRLHPDEIEVAELAQRVRELYLEIDATKVTSAISAFDAALKTSSEEALTLLGEGSEDAFGVDATTGSVRSVKPHKVKKLLLENLGFDTPTTSLKKLNPHKLAMAPRAAAALKATSEMSKVLSHRRRVSGFAGLDVVDVELGYFRAHTGRYSSPNPGKGVNLHNLPKRNKDLAKAIRSMYWLPEGYCWVRADLSSVEYRILGWLSNCKHTLRLYTDDALADAYVAFWLAATGQRISKKDAARQLAKAAVLGLGFCMGLPRWMHELMLAQSDPNNGLTLPALEAIANEQGWTLDRWGRAAQSKTHAADALARVAQGTQAAFHAVHPEFMAFANWLERAVNDASRAMDPPGALALAYRSAGSPRPDRCQLIWENTPDLERSVRAQCGVWPSPTVTWRDIGVRPVGFDGGMAMSSRQAGSKGFRVLTRQILVENVTQATARNALVQGKRMLHKLGWEYLLSVHDELLIACPLDRDEILRARSNLLDVFGPGNSLGYGPAVIINPEEINVSRSLYETELGMDWWKELLTAGDPSKLLNELS